ncbi:CGNR zinc finger domain-containing protein [Polymorphospora sp. NPDC050346]|uniref:CGNR zinc finger domain-containing protein n=1 Tax=Polymorphospora sp. NPDC050346 TaxID=3155780 RepID=UPI0033BFD4E0
MHWVEVDGYPMPVLLGGHPALDFCNTWAGWDTPPTPDQPPTPDAPPTPDRPDQDWLGDFDRLAVWAGHAGLLSPDTVRRLRDAGHLDPAGARQAVDDARRLRSALHDVLLDPTDEAAFRHVAAQARRAAGHAVLENGPDGVARWTLPADTGPALPVLAAARAGADLLSTPERTRIRACPGEMCGWLFLDPRGRRRWCSMAACGNRAKVRAYASRHRPG